MEDKETRELAEAHWNYTEQIILHQIELMHRLYIEAMLHGYGHGYEDCEKKLKDEPRKEKNEHKSNTG